MGSLVMDTKGNLYGTTAYGGVDQEYCSCGIVFKLTADGKEDILWSFAGDIDGLEPLSGLLMDKTGNLYGTTYYGGDSCDGVCGTVFKIKPDDIESIEYPFCSQYACADGSNPYAGLVADDAGNFFGTTEGAGAIYELTPKGSESVLYSGEMGPAGLVLGAHGILFGVTLGTIFEVSPGGAYTLLYSFAGGLDGSDAWATPILAKDVLYGTTVRGGSSGCGGGGCGTIYKFELDHAASR